MLTPVDPIDRAKVARRFACSTPERMRWTADRFGEVALCQCHGCQSFCGTSYAGLFTKPAEQLSLLSQ